MRNILLLALLIVLVSCEKEPVENFEVSVVEENTTLCNGASIEYQGFEVCQVNANYERTGSLDIYEYIYIGSQYSFLMLMIEPDEDAAECYPVMDGFFMQLYELPWNPGDPIYQSPGDLDFSITSNDGFPEGVFNGTISQGPVTGSFED